MEEQIYLTKGTESTTSSTSDTTIFKNKILFKFYLNKRL